MILSMHQPNFIPWSGYFHKIAGANVFVILDNVQFPRGKSIANRNLLKGSDGLTELVVPVSRTKGNEGKVKFNEIKFARQDWYEKKLKTIQRVYGKSKNFETYFPKIESIFRESDFSEMNIKFIEFICHEMDISTTIVRQSALDPVSYTTKNDLIVKLCERFHAKIYLSGNGAAAYNNQEYLASNGILLTYINYQPEPYPQLGVNFHPNLSVIDLLFNADKEKMKAHIMQQHDYGVSLRSAS